MPDEHDKTSIKELKKRLHDWNVLVAQGCTPGGSEFHNDPARVAAYLKDLHHKGHSLIKRAIRQRIECRVENETLQSKIRNLEADKLILTGIVEQNNKMLKDHI